MSEESRKPNSFVAAARELSAAIRYHADKGSSRRKKRDLRGIADKLMTWGNLVFVGLVIAQVFSGHFDARIAAVGISLFLAAYILAVVLYNSKGGETS